MRSVLAFLALTCLSAAEVKVTSPDGSIQFVLASNTANHLEYTVTRNSKTVMERSILGIMVDQVDFAAAAKIGAAETYTVNEKYPWYGAHSTAVDHCNGAKVAITHPKGSYTLEIRAYDDGIAFRHLVPGQGTRTPDEVTEFHVPAGAIIAPVNYVSGYEGVYPWRTTRNTIESMMDGEWTLPPFTYRLADGSAYASITEGALLNYSGMTLQSDANSVFHARLGHSAPATFGFRSRYAKDVAPLSHAASIAGPITTPWRIIMVGADLNALVNADIVHNVAPPPDPKLFPRGALTDWIKPGRGVWSYLDGTDSSVAGQKAMARLAGELGFEYNVLENFWRNWTEAQLKDVVEYHRARGVGVILWSSRASVTEPQKLKEWFDLCNRVGVAGVKIDFFDHEHKDVVDLYEMMAKAGAEHHLLVDFHGANKPTGLERTYPNVVGVEGIRGMEFPGPYAQLDVTLPFTRALAGLADYTPTHFSKMADTTWAHQVANAVILQAPLLVYAAHPANMLANPSADVLKSIPSHWDETVVLPVSEIREVAAFARRSGNTWYLAITNGPNARILRIDLASFLGRGEGRGASYQSTLLRDAGEAAALTVEHLTLSVNDSITVQLRSGGGFVARLQR